MPELVPSERPSKRRPIVKPEARFHCGLSSSLGLRGVFGRRAVGDDDEEAPEVHEDNTAIGMLSRLQSRIGDVSVLERRKRLEEYMETRKRARQAQEARESLLDLSNPGSEGGMSYSIFDRSDSPVYSALDNYPFGAMPTPTDIAQEDPFEMPSTSDPFEFIPSSSSHSSVLARVRELRERREVLMRQAQTLREQPRQPTNVRRSSPPMSMSLSAFLAADSDGDDVGSRLSRLRAAINSRRSALNDASSARALAAAIEEDSSDEERQNGESDQEEEEDEDEDDDVNLSDSSDDGRGWV